MKNLTTALSILALCICATVRADPLKAALFVDDGCRGAGLVCWAEILRDSPDVDCRLVSGADIRAGALDGRELLVMPGGAGKPQYGALGDEGADRIRAFVAAGGKYFGTCCGFSNALNEKNNGYAKRLCMVPFRNLKQPRKCRGGLMSTVKVNARGAEWLGLKAGEYGITYHNGPVVTRTEDVPLCSNVVVLATDNCEVAQFGAVADSMYGTPAIVKADYGKGTMLLFNCHPERFAKSRVFVSAGIRALTGHDVRIVEQPLKPRGAERVGFFCGTLGSKAAVEAYFTLRADPGVDVVPVTRSQLDEDWHGRFDRVVSPAADGSLRLLDAK